MSQPTAMSRHRALVVAASLGLVVLSQLTVAMAQGDLQNGINHPGAISVAQEIDVWTFEAAAGDSIALSLGKVGTESDLWPWLRLRRSDGTEVGNEVNGWVAQVDVTADQAGTYTVVVGSNSRQGGSPLDGTGEYTLILAQTPKPFVVSAGDEGGPMVNGANHTGTIQRGDLDLWTFEAAVGDSIALSLGKVGTESDLWPWVRLRRPDGTEVGNDVNGWVAQVDVTADQAGTYTVVVGSNTRQGGTPLYGTGEYTLILAQTPKPLVVSAGDEGGPMVNGANLTGTIQRGDLDLWTFEAVTRDSIALSLNKVGTDSDLWPWLRLRRPDGTEVGNEVNGSAARIAILASQTGTYTVIVGSNSRQGGTPLYGSGDYALRLVRLAPDLIVPETQVIEEGATWNVSISAVDPETPGKTLLFELLSAPAGVALTPVSATNATLSWVTTEVSGPSTNTVVARVTDVVGFTSYRRTNSFQVIVQEVNDAPVLQPIEARETLDETVFRLSVQASDTDLPANLLTYELLPGTPAGVVLDAATGDISWPIGTLLTPEVHVIRVKVSDNGVPPLSAETSVQVTVRPPVLRLAPIADVEIDELTLLSVAAMVTNSPLAIPPLAYSFEGTPPDGASLNAASGALFWRPREEHGPGTHVIRLRVTDSASPAQTSVASFSVMVREVNQAPVLAAMPSQSIPASGSLSLVVQATDSDLPANGLTYSLDAGAPSDMTIHPTLGAIAWVPGAAFAGSTNRITVRVTDDGSPALSGTQTLVVRVGDLSETRIRGEQTPEGLLRLLLTGNIGRTYLIESSSDLTRWSIVTNFVASQEVTEILEPALGGSESRFYRAVSP
jgi:hypothetical protein